MAEKIYDDIVAFLQKHRVLFAAFFIFSLALFIRLSYLETTVVDHPIRADAKKYVSYAINLLERGVYSQDLVPNPSPDNQVTPGYPLLLAAIFKLSPDLNTACIRLLFVQAILGAATAVLTFAVGRFILSYWLAVLSGMLTALSPHLVTMGGYILTEAFFGFLLMLSFWILMVAIRSKKTEYFFICAVIMGFASLVRPALLLFPFLVVPLVLFYWRPESRKKISLALILGVILVWSPWSIWSKISVPHGTGKSGLALSSFVFGTYPDMIHKDPRLKGYPYREDPEYQKMSNDLGVAFKVLGTRFVEQPLKYLKWYIFGKPMMFWSWNILVGQGDIYVYPVKTSLYKTNAFADFTRQVMKYIHPVFVIIVMAGVVLLVLGVWKQRIETKKNIFAVLLSFLLLVYFTSVHMMLASLPRYSIPLQPLLYVCGFFSITFFKKTWLNIIINHTYRYRA